MAMRREGIMRAASLVLVSGALAMSSSFADAQVAGSTKLGVAVEEVKLVAVGWSARNIIGKTVYNENNQRVGKIEDLIVAPDSAISFAIVGAGGFAGMGRHDVAIPVQQIQLQDDGKFVPARSDQGRDQVAAPVRVREEREKVIRALARADPDMADPPSVGLDQLRLSRARPSSSTRALVHRA